MSTGDGARHRAIVSPEKKRKKGGGALIKENAASIFLKDQLAVARLAQQKHPRLRTQEEKRLAAWYRQVVPDWRKKLWRGRIWRVSKRRERWLRNAHRNYRLARERGTDNRFEDDKWKRLGIKQEGEESS